MCQFLSFLVQKKRDGGNVKVGVRFHRNVVRIETRLFVDVLCALFCKLCKNNTTQNRGPTAAITVVWSSDHVPICLYT